MPEVEVTPPDFRVTVNKINQVTVPAEIRKIYDIGEDDDLILTFKGKVKKSEKIEPPKSSEISSSGNNK